jgi:hypothetical protein
MQTPLTPNTRRVRTNTLVLLANGISLLALSLIIFRLQAPATFFRYDGTLMLSLVKSQAEWMSWGVAYTIDLLRGMGGVNFPLNSQLMPGFVVGLLTGTGNWLPAVSATWFAFEFAVGTLLIGRAIGVPLPANVMAVWLGLLGALPYVVPTPALERIWGNPWFLSFISFTMIALALFAEVGRGSRLKSFACAAGIFGILAYVTCAFTLFAPNAFPILLFFGGLCIATAKDRAERQWKLTTTIVIGALYLACFGVWLSGFYLYSKMTYFLAEMYPLPISWRWTSLLLEGPALRPLGVVFYIGALFGGAVAAIGRATPLRSYAIGYLAFNGLLWLFTAILILTRPAWHGGLPAPYLDLMLYPLHALFAAYLLYGAWLRLSALWHERSAPIRLMTYVIFVPWVVLAFWKPPFSGKWKNYLSFPWPPDRTPIVEFLEHRIALQPGQPFRGRAVNLAGGDFLSEFVNAPFISQHGYDAVTAISLGNDHREYGFWYYNVPTLEESNHSASPFFHLLMSRLLNPDGVWFFRVHETANVFNENVLANLGVRFALTEHPLPERTPVLAIDVRPQRKQYLYELPDANVFGRAASRVTVARTATEALARMRSSDYDIRNEAVLFDPLPEGNLAPVFASRLEVHRGFVSLSAEASGRALIVLPLEFSRCLEFKWTSGDGRLPIALRANLNQTAILFDGRVEGRIALRYGPFENPGCRLRDMHDADRVDLAAVPKAIPR